MAKRKIPAKPSVKNAEAFGRLLAHFRSLANLSLRDVAAGAGLQSHTFIGALERGEILPSSDMIQRLADAINLGPDDRARFQMAASEQAHGLTMKLWIPVETLVKRQTVEDIIDVWVAVEYPLELDDDKYLDVVAQLLKEGKSYVYFIKDPAIWETLKQRFEKKAHVPLTQLASKVTAIQPPEIVRPFFFNPPFVLLIKRDGVLGTIAMRGPESQVIDSGIQMDPATVNSRFSALREVVEQIRHKVPFSASETTKQNYKVL